MERPKPESTNASDTHVENAAQSNEGTHIPSYSMALIRMAVLVSIGGLIFGYDTGQISGFLEMEVFLARFGERTDNLEKHPTGYYFSNVRAGLIVGLLSIGTFFGCMTSGTIANRYGRKTTFIPWCILHCIGIIVQMTVGSGGWLGLSMGRWLSGLAVGGLSVLVPLYMTEVSPVSLRGPIISCYQLLITMGMLIACSINFGTERLTSPAAYQIPMGAGFLWAGILGLGSLFLPESPRYDWYHEKPERARATMATMYGVDQNHPAIEAEIQEMEQVREASQNRRPWYKSFAGPKIKLRTYISMQMQTLQQLTGANFFFYYGTSIFASVGIPNSYITAMILTAVNVVGTVVGVFLARRFSRRVCLIVGGLFQAACFLVITVVAIIPYKDAPDGSDQEKSAGIVMIVFACLFILSYASTWGPLTWACIGEMFPYQQRGLGMGFATSANWFWNFMLAFFTPFITAKIGFAYGFVFWDLIFHVPFSFTSSFVSQLEGLWRILICCICWEFVLLELADTYSLKRIDDVVMRFVRALDSLEEKEGLMRVVKAKFSVMKGCMSPGVG